MVLEHQAVLLQEAVKGLNIKPDGIYVDCTLGRAGHSKEILKYLTTGKLYCFEQDQQAIKISKEILRNSNSTNYEIINNNFVNLESELLIRNVSKVDGILYDLGVSSPQLDEDTRGFSYHLDGILDMRMNQSQSLTAKEVINSYSETALTKIFYNYGEEPFAKKIAKEIVTARNKAEIRTTLELVAVIKRALPQKVLKKTKHPAKRIFQAIRIEVNQELFVLQESLQQASKMLNQNGRLVIISFHSLEDRIVKNYFLSLIKDPNDEINRQLPTMSNYESNYQLVTKKAIIPSAIELAHNRRSTSAKLRILERVK